LFSSGAASRRPGGGAWPGLLRALEQELDPLSKLPACCRHRSCRRQVLGEDVLQAPVRRLRVERVRQEGGKAAPCVRVVGAALRSTDEVFDLVLEDRLDKGLACREASVERADPDAGPVRDVLERGVDTVLGEDGPRHGDDSLPIPAGVAAERPGRLAGLESVHWTTVAA
jgi:hypothetical protein